MNIIIDIEQSIMKDESEKLMILNIIWNKHWNKHKKSYVKIFIL